MTTLAGLVNVLRAVVAGAASPTAIGRRRMMCCGEIDCGKKVFMTPKTVACGNRDRGVATMTGAATKGVDVNGVVVFVRTLVQCGFPPVGQETMTGRTVALGVIGRGMATAARSCA